MRQGIRGTHTLATRTAMLGAVIACAGAASAPADAASATDRALNAQLRQLVALPGGPPGAIAVVQRGRTITVHRAGVTRPGGRAPRARDRMRIASVSKTFTGATALALVREGRLRLDDTIGELVPDLPRTWHAVTLAQLMRHTSGVPDFIANDAAQAALRGSLGRAPAPRALLRFVEDRPLNFPPGSRYRYSNSDNVIIGLAVERVTGMSFTSVLAGRVLRPLGLRDTSLPRGTGLAAPSLRGFAPDPPGPPTDVTNVLAAGWAWAAGGVVSSPADVNRFIRSYVSAQPAALRGTQRMTVAGSSEPTGPGINRAGLSLYRYTTRCGVVWGHTGNTLGYTQFAAASPDGTRSAVVSVSAQISPRTDPVLFPRLRAINARAVCAALGR